MGAIKRKSQRKADRLGGQKGKGAFIVLRNSEKNGPGTVLSSRGAKKLLRAYSLREKDLSCFSGGTDG